MNEKLKGLWEKVKETLKKVSKKVYIAAAVVLVALIAVIAVLAATHKPEYSVLFTGLSSSETSSVVTYLDSLGVTDYKVENRDTILVPAAQEENLKVRLLMEGYPQSGFAYDYSTYYENIGALSTESERRTAFLHDLQDKMSAVVRCFDNVKDATVDIGQGEDNSFILDSSKVTKTTASVLVEMDGAVKLTSQQAAAIRNYVAHAVEGLEIEAVYISDTMGNNYSTGGSMADSEASALKMQLEEEWENKIRTSVMQVLIPFYGEDNVRTSVNCTVDVSQKTVSSRDVFLPDYATDGSTNGKGIIGSQVYSYYVTRPNDGTVGGLVGSETNSDLPEYVEDIADPNGTETDIGGDGEVIYDNPYEETVALYTAGYLTDCSISVSINAKEAGDIDVQSIRQHIARAAGIEGTVDAVTGVEYLNDRISVVSAPFYEPPAEPIIPMPEGLQIEEWMLYAAGGALLLIIILIIVIIVIAKKHKKKKLLRQQAEMEAALAAARLAQAGLIEADEGADVMDLQTEKSMELRRDIREFAENNPEIAAQTIKVWLRGGSV